MLGTQQTERKGWRLPLCHFCKLKQPLGATICPVKAIFMKSLLHTSFINKQIAGSWAVWGHENVMILMQIGGPTSLGTKLQAGNFQKRPDFGTHQSALILKLYSVASAMNWMGLPFIWACFPFLESGCVWAPEILQYIHVHLTRYLPVLIRQPISWYAACNMFLLTRFQGHVPAVEVSARNPFSISCWGSFPLYPEKFVFFAASQTCWDGTNLVGGRVVRSPADFSSLVCATSCWLGSREKRNSLFPHSPLPWGAQKHSFCPCLA